MSTDGGSALTSSQQERRRSGVRWDEPNLEENERIKAALQPQIRINEPKTPYHGPSPEEESDDGSAHMAPLTLEDEDHGQSSIRREHNDAVRMEEMESRFPSDLEAAASPPRHTSWEGSVAGPSSYCSSEDEEQQAEKRRKFEERRKKHYHISEAARQALHRTQAEELAKSSGASAGTRDGDDVEAEEEDPDGAAPM